MRLPVSYVEDASVHEQMVRFATRAIEHGALPYTSWFPYVGLGSDQYLHYQSLASVITGLAGTVVGGDTAFRWSMYLLIAFWPGAVYSSGRLFGLPRPASTAAALLSPFVVSFTGIAFERGAYSFTGGAEVWTQLFGSWALVFALASTWRALGDARFIWLASALVGLTVALHFLCGYLALLGIVVMALVAQGRVVKRVARAAVIFAASLLAAAWVEVPLLLSTRWSAINADLAATQYVRGYGARQELKWLFTGQFFDARRALPVISIAVGVGAVVAIARWRADPLGRALIALFAGALLLSFGATTWGPLVDLVPAHADLYFRRFTMGSQLAGTFLAGMATAFAWEAFRRLMASFGTSTGLRLGTVACFSALILAWFSPAYNEIARYDRFDAATIASQRKADSSAGDILTPLINYVKHHGGGRAYAGQGNNWGQDFRVGLVPVYKYLESQDVEEVAYLVPTLSLMLDPEGEFDEDNPADYALFGVRYIFLPAGTGPPVPAKEVMTRGMYSLWQVDGTGYVELVRVAGTLSANRADIGSKSAVLLEVLGPNQDWAVQWPGTPRPPRPQVSGYLGDPDVGSPGVVESEQPDLADGALSTDVELTEPGTLLLSAAYDPGWHAWVNGRPAKTEMLAPALVGVELPAGRYHVVFRYTGFRWYPELWGVALASLVVAFVLGRRSYQRPAAADPPGPADSGAAGAPQARLSP
jgi:hypothetical protein